jgi:FtsP/CotA-like multicopper oxidase with cupredoxin domain
MGAGGHDMGGMGGMGGGEGMSCGCHGEAPALGAPMDVLRIRIAREEAETLALPARLSAPERHSLDAAVNKDQPRQIAISMGRMQWQLNGRVYEMGVVAEDELVKRGDLELWELINEGDGDGDTMMGSMTMAHPFHIHGGQFQIVGRQVTAGGDQAWRALSEGFVDGGRKDTVLLMPGERVRVLIRFDDFTGDYPYHCHNMEHEDGGMMRVLRVEA